VAGAERRAPMRTTVLAVALAVLACSAPVRPAGAALLPTDTAQDSPQSRLMCAADFFAEPVDRSLQTVVLHLRKSRGPLAGTIEAYGSDHVWSVTSRGGVAVPNSMRIGDEEFVVRAGVPITAIVFKPSWASCLMFAAVRPYRSVAPFFRSPAVDARDDGPVEPTQCDHPFIAAAVIRAVEPDIPAMAQQQGIAGTVDIAVALGVRNNVEAVAVASSPSAILNASALASARNSVYQTAIAGCKPVPSAYLFSVSYSSR
jgi:hypothetical protein